MKSMKIQKQFPIEDGIAQIIHLQVKEELTYTKEEEGIRARGPIHLQGLYQNKAGAVRQLKEELELNVLAPKHKLGGEPFSLQLAEYHGEVGEEGLLLTLTLLAEGLREEAEQEASEEECDVSAAAEEQSEEGEQEEIREFEDLFEDADTTYTSCRMIVARSEDTYETIAARYEVNEAQLRSCNHEKPVAEKTLILLPKSAVRL